MFYLCNILPVLMTQQPFQTSLQNERETIFTHPSVFYSAHQLHNEHQPAAAPNFCSLDVVWSLESGQSHSSVLGSQRPLVSLTLHCFDRWRFQWRFLIPWFLFLRPALSCPVDAAYSAPPLLHYLQTLNYVFLVAKWLQARFRLMLQNVVRIIH